MDYHFTPLLMVVSTGSGLKCLYYFGLCGAKADNRNKKLHHEGTYGISWFLYGNSNIVLESRFSDKRNCDTGNLGVLCFA